MIHLFYSNSHERLLAGLCEQVRQTREGSVGLPPPVTVVVPSQGVSDWLRHALARSLGVAARIETIYLGELLVRTLLPKDGSRRMLERKSLGGLVLAVLCSDALARDALAPIRRYLEAVGSDEQALGRRKAKLATRLGYLLEEYAYGRPELLDAWGDGRLALADGPHRATEQWEAELYRCVLRVRDGLVDTAAAWRMPHELVLELSETTEKSFRPIALFGLGHVARLFHDVLSWLAGRTDVFVYAQNPCREFWEDMATGKQARRARKLPKRQRGVPLSLDPTDPFDLAHPEDPAALIRWGRPGRENIRVLDTLSACDFASDFIEPLDRGRSLLRCVQSDILNRRSPRALPEIPAGDDSLVVYACPSFRRQCETAAQVVCHILSLAEKNGTPTRLCDIGVIVVGDARLRMPLLAAAFEQPGFAIPYVTHDLELVERSRILQAARALLALPLGAMTRREILSIVTHPCTVHAPDEKGAQLFEEACEAVGVFRGACREDLGESVYFSDDLVTWDQGLARLALMPMVDQESEGLFRSHSSGSTHRVTPHFEGERDAIWTLGLVVRSLLADARSLRVTQLPVGEWGTRLERYLAAYLRPEGDRELRELSLLTDALRAFESVTDTLVSYSVAHTMAEEALRNLKTDRQKGTDQGVTIGTFESLRGVPMHALLIVGMDQRAFPSAERASDLDLRFVQRRAGDVGDRERDQYLFLEAMLAAENHLVFTYSDRDETTADPLEPSSTLLELLQILSEEYVDSEGMARIVRRVPLMRHDESWVPAPVGRGDACTLPTPARYVEEARWALVGSLQDRALAAELLASPNHAHHMQSGCADRSGDGVPETAKPIAASRCVPLGALVAYLQCPLQGAARFHLGLENDDQMPRRLASDEPLETPDFTLVPMLQRLAYRAVREGVAGGAWETVTGWYDAEVRDAQARGGAALGHFHEQERQEHLDGLRGYLGIIRARLGATASHKRAVLGGAHTPDAVDVAREPQRIALPRTGRDGAEVSLAGAVEWLEPASPQSPRVHARLMLRDAPRECGCRVDALTGLVSHLILCAMGWERATEILLVYRGGRAYCLSLPAQQAKDAISTLGTMAEDLLYADNTRLAPLEGLLDLRGNENPKAVDRLLRKAEKAPRTPIRDTARFPCVGVDEGIAIRTRRFALLTGAPLVRL